MNYFFQSPLNFYAKLIPAKNRKCCRKSKLLCIEERINCGGADKSKFTVVLYIPYKVTLGDKRMPGKVKV